jgi:hypothetical protein
MMKWILNNKTNPKDKATVFEEVHQISVQRPGRFDECTGFAMVEIERYDPISEEWFNNTVPVWRLTMQEEDDDE